MNTHFTSTANSQSCLLDMPVAAASEVLRVLLVDDDPAYRMLCKRYLKKDPTRQFDTHTASTAADAMAACLEREYDCLVIDYQLPDSTGTAALDSLRETFGDRLPPAIILTADGGEEAATNAVRSGALDFMSKRNVSVQSLCRVVNNAIDKGAMRRTLRRQNIEIRETNQSLKNRNDEIRRFYHTVSHEVKTPLTATREFISLVKDGVVGTVTNDQSDLLSLALESCDQITRQFDEMLDLARLESGKMRLQLQQCSLEDMLARSLASCAHAARDRNVRLIEPGSATLPAVSADANRIVQVLSNLLGNAVKFTPEGGQVELRVELDPKGEQVRLSVIDSGCGIDSSELEYVFDRLYQSSVPDGQAQAGGLGLGLSIAFEIVRMHDQLLSVSSVPGIGSTFAFDLAVVQRTKAEYTVADK